MGGCRISAGNTIRNGRWKEARETVRIVASPACRCRPNFFLRVLEGLRCGSPSSRNASCSRLPMPVFCMGNGRAVHLVNNSGARGIRQLRAWPPPQICACHQPSPFCVSAESKDGGTFYVPSATPLSTPCTTPSGKEW